METIQENFVQQQKPAFTDWMRSLKMRAEAAAREEAEEQRWRETRGR